MFFIYILESERDSTFYVGHTQNVEMRLTQHNAGHSRSTRLKRPWKLVYQEQFETRSEAMNREKEIKKRKSRTYKEELIKQYKSGD